MLVKYLFNLLKKHWASTKERHAEAKGGMHIGSGEGKQGPELGELLLNLRGAGRRTGDEACPPPAKPGVWLETASQSWNSKEEHSLSGRVNRERHLPRSTETCPSGAPYSAEGEKTPFPGNLSLLTRGTQMCYLNSYYLHDATAKSSSEKFKVFLVVNPKDLPRISLKESSPMELGLSQASRTSST